MTREEFEALQVGDRVINERSKNEYAVTSTSIYFGEPTISLKTIPKGWGDDEFVMTISARERDMYGVYRKKEDGDA